MPPRQTIQIKSRPRAGRTAGVVISLLFALLVTPIVLADRWLVPDAPFEVGQPAPITVRVPPFAGFRDEPSGLSAGHGAIVVVRGEIVDAERAELVAVLRERSRGDLTEWLGFAVALFLLGLLYATAMRSSHRGRLLRTQAVSLLLVVAVAAGVKAALMLSPLSVLLVPVAGAAIVATLTVDLFAGLVTALAAAFVIGSLVPFDVGIVAVLAVQGVAAVMTLGDGRRRWKLLGAGVLGGAAAAATYLVFHFLSWGELPARELAEPAGAVWLAAAAGGVLSGLVAIPAQPVYQWLLGDITRNRLVELEDLSNPLLKQIAEQAPGTWQHSLAMANMAEIAANAIGASGRLVRVGAYYHDLGKSLQPRYYVENLPSGETSPHDSLPPEVSCDAIFSHVTEGVRLGKKARLPERVIDFMHMHHGDGLLEYFWAKCQEQGNPAGLTADDFRYPGVRPQSRETAILAICDAVEAASRTLRQPDAQAIETLVQRIVYGKLHLGQLDESGLSVADLRKISNALMETIKHAHHVRIEYPWQRAARQAAADAEERDTARGSRKAAAAVVAPTGDTGPGDRRSATQRIMQEPPLDSLDVPRPVTRSVRARSRSRSTAPPEMTDTSAWLDPFDTGEHAAPGGAAAPATAPAPAPAPATGDEPTAPPDRDGVETVLEVKPRVSAVPVPVDDPGTQPVVEIMVEHSAPARPPPPGRRPPPATIPLMSDGERPGAVSSRAGVARASSEGGDLAPGVVVLGPPPATHAGRSGLADAADPDHGPAAADDDDEEAAPAPPPERG